MISQFGIISSANNSINLISEGGVFGEDNYTLLQSLINTYSGRTILLPAGGTIYTSRPLVLPSNTKLRIDSNLKLTDGVIRPLTQDAATGQNRVYVNNADGAFKVGQWASVGADNYPVGGGGATPRKMAQCAMITVATATYVEFEYNLRTTISGVAVDQL